MDELEQSLDRLADRGAPRGAHRVFDGAAGGAAPSGGRRLRPVLVVAGVAVAGVVAVIGSFVVADDRDRDRVEAELLAVVEPASGLEPRAPFAVIGSVVVGAGDGPTILYSLDRGRTWATAVLVDAPAGTPVAAIQRDGDELVATIVVSRTDGSGGSGGSLVTEPFDVHRWRSTDGITWTSTGAPEAVVARPVLRPDGVELPDDVARAVADIDPDAEPLLGLPLGDTLLVPLVGPDGRLLHLIVVAR
jgi:hypothetical protein